MNIVNIITNYKSQFYPNIPWRTGRLATTGMGDIYSPYGQNSVGFDFCRNPGLQYGIILNEAPVIRYNLNGKQGNYTNRHFGYFDNFFDRFVLGLATQLGGTLIEGEQP